MQWIKCQFCENKGKRCHMLLAQNSTTGECEKYKLANRNFRISVKNYFPDLYFAEELGLIKFSVDTSEDIV